MDTMTEAKNFDRSDLWIDACYILGLAINLWIIDVTLLDGVISKAVGRKLVVVGRRIQVWQERERTFIEQKPWVIFDALNIIDESGKPNDG